MKIKNIASGSSGNVTLLSTDNANILIDCGISCKRIADGLKEEGMSYDDIDAILITHEHIDHIKALGVIERKRSIPVYATEGTIRGIRQTASLGNYPDDVFVRIGADNSFDINGAQITALNVFHDAYEPVCYKIESGNSAFAVVTDLGEYNEYLIDNLKGLDGILLEANHDVRMLEVGPYPYPLKQRILGKYGHLSNESSGRLLARLLHDKIKYIMLGHLSKENNTRELARLAVEMEIDFSDNCYRGKDFDIRVARRDETSEAVII